MGFERVNIDEVEFMIWKDFAFPSWSTHGVLVKSRGPAVYRPATDFRKQTRKTSRLEYSRLTTRQMKVSHRILWMFPYEKE